MYDAELSIVRAPAARRSVASAAVVALALVPAACEGLHLAFTYGLPKLSDVRTKQLNASAAIVDAPTS